MNSIYCECQGIRFFIYFFPIQRCGNWWNLLGRTLYAAKPLTILSTTSFIVYLVTVKPCVAGYFSGSMYNGCFHLKRKTSVKEVASPPKGQGYKKIFTWIGYSYAASSLLIVLCYEVVNFPLRNSNFYPKPVLWPKHKKGLKSYWINIPGTK